MPLTSLDPKTALIVIDLQHGLMAYPTIHPLSEIVERAGRLADAFRRRHLPVALVAVNARAPGRTEQGGGSLPRTDGWDALVPELNRQASDILVTKRTWGAFSHTDLEARLRQAGVTQVVVTGVSTSAGVESTARQAHELGFNVTLAIDAMTDTNPETHANSLTRIFPRLGETGTTDQILTLLSGDA